MIKNLELLDEESQPEPENEFSAEIESPFKRTSDLSRDFNPAEEDESENLPLANLQLFTPLPWRSLLALFLALLAQWNFEPPHQGPSAATGGLLVYLAAFAMLTLAYLNGEWRLPPYRKFEEQFDSLRISLIKIVAILLGVFLAFAAFFTFTDNRFTLFNTFPWLLAIFLFVWGLWRTGEKKEKIKINPKWGILLLAVSAIILFFRFYQTGTVPPEPFSDHAEKILDVYDISQGETRIFFPRNTGREAIQMYWTLLVAKVFGTGLSFFSLKLGTALLGLLTLPYIYLLGKEVANKRVGLIAVFLMGISYWHNVISRVGLRFPLYPLFVAPTLFYLLRGIRRQSRNDFILAGLFLGLGSHGYSPFRIMPFVIVAAIAIYLIHKQSRGVRQQIIIHLIFLALISVIVFLPLGRYALENPNGFSYRAFSRLDNGTGEGWKIFASNLWDGIKMFNWDNGGIWVHSVGLRPALGVVSGAFFIIGVVLLLVRYFSAGHWLDLYLPLSILLLQLPSTLSIAYPEENPALNRMGGAAVVVFVVVALAVDGLLSSLRSRSFRGLNRVFAWGVPILLVGISLFQNYNLVFNTYADYFRIGAWNSSEMGAIIQEFGQEHDQTDTIWIVPYEHWVDTRLPGVWAGIPNRNFGLWSENLYQTLDFDGPKLFMYKPEDEEALEELLYLYPDGILTRYISKVPNHDFMIYRVP
jgi:4-amino-4-deoxy-L-arabinose transferase-like glycosyltransferase